MNKLVTCIFTIDNKKYSDYLVNRILKNRMNILQNVGLANHYPARFDSLLAKLLAANKFNQDNYEDGKRARALIYLTKEEIKLFNDVADYMNFSMLHIWKIDHRKKYNHLYADLVRKYRARFERFLIDFHENGTVVYTHGVPAANYFEIKNELQKTIRSVKPKFKPVHIATFYC